LFLHLAQQLQDEYPDNKKTVTIRGVDRDLYDQFVNLTTSFGGNVGIAFSSLLYMKNRQNIGLIHNHIKKIIHNKEKHIKFELIENVDYLSISHEDLISAGDGIKYIFKNINQLVFDETVDNKTLLNYVHRIVHSKVEIKGTISKLFLLSINQSKRQPLPISGKLKDVTIRNVYAPIYDEFVGICHTEKITIGDGVNNLFSEFIPFFEIHHLISKDHNLSIADFIIISMQAEISITEQDLIDLENRSVIFHRISKLNFDPNINPSIFIKYVNAIYFSQELQIPDEIPKLIRLSRVVSLPDST